MSKDSIRDSFFAISFSLCLVLSPRVAAAQATISEPMDFITLPGQPDADKTCPVERRIPNALPPLSRLSSGMGDLAVAPMPSDLSEAFQRQFDDPTHILSASSKNSAAKGYPIRYPELVNPLEFSATFGDVTQSFLRGRQYATINEELAFIKDRLIAKQYFAKYYVLNDGYAILLPFEIITETGQPILTSDRWVLSKRPCESWISFWNGFAFGVYGRFRSVLIVISDDLKIQDPGQVLTNYRPVENFPEHNGKPKKIYMVVYEGNIDNDGRVGRMKQNPISLSDHLKSF